MFLRFAPWTLFLATALVAVHFVPAIASAPAFARELPRALEFDRSAILAGDAWRIWTGNVVHWSGEHLALDVGAFLVVGLLFERAIGRAYPWVLLASATAVGGAVLVFGTEVNVYRGLSGVASGQFAIAVLFELRRARSREQLALSIGGVLLLAAKLAYEGLTGHMMFGTEALGDIGVPLPLAHIAGTVGAVAVVFAMFALRSSDEARRTPVPRLGLELADSGRARAE